MIARQVDQALETGVRPLEVVANRAKSVETPFRRVVRVKIDRDSREEIRPDQRRQSATAPIASVTV